MPLFLLENHMSKKTPFTIKSRANNNINNEHIYLERTKKKKYLHIHYPKDIIKFSKACCCPLTSTMLRGISRVEWSKERRQLKCVVKWPRAMCSALHNIV
ncbi:unnamed protein product [Ceratitis capitata]|uniref:(Mediterranean fruit fly) hypothetical protein n=1 Tax=Ceratitis capitata TaxID=7213 RepID=A0A811U5Y7_CERCA|nr:unnamed protein product [Ceratitis capitata]